MQLAGGRSLRTRRPRRKVAAAMTVAAPTRMMSFRTYCPLERRAPSNPRTAGGQQHQWRENADELGRQQPHRDAHRPPGDQGGADEGFQCGGEDHADPSGDQAEEQDVGAGFGDGLGGADAREVLQDAEAQEGETDRDAPRCDAVGDELMMEDVL